MTRNEDTYSKSSDYRRGWGDGIVNGLKAQERKMAQRIVKNGAESQSERDYWMGRIDAVKENK